MKKHLTTLVFSFALLPLMAQGTLSEANKEKAQKKASAEATMFQKKEMENKSSSASVEDAIKDFYMKVYTEDSPNKPRYIWGMGTGKSSSASVAYEDALKSANAHIPGLLATYFSMWITTADNLSEEEKSKVQSAVSDATPVFAEVLLEKDPFQELHLQGESKGKFKSQVRVLYKQIEAREIAREAIKEFLKEKTDWSDEKMTRVLTFEH